MRGCNFSNSRLPSALHIDSLHFDVHFSKIWRIIKRLAHPFSNKTQQTIIITMIISNFSKIKRNRARNHSSTWNIFTQAIFTLLIVTSIRSVTCYTIGTERIPTRTISRISTTGYGSSHRSNWNSIHGSTSLIHREAIAPNSIAVESPSPSYTNEDDVDDYLEFLDRRYRYVDEPIYRRYCGYFSH